MSRVRVFLIATFIIAVTPRLSADIILRSRLSDARAEACGHPFCQISPPQSETGFLQANLRNFASGGNHCPLIPCDCGGTATSTSNSSILINNPTEGLRVVGDGTATTTGCVGYASAKLIVLSFTLTDVPYPYSMTGQLNVTGSTATLTSETGTIFERSGTTTLSESGTLPPGNYTLSVEVNGSGGYGSNANFIFVLDGPVSTPRSNESLDPVVGWHRRRRGHWRVHCYRQRAPLAARHWTIVYRNSESPTFLSRSQSLSYNGPSASPPITNDNWRDTQEDAIIATGRAPTNDLESASRSRPACRSLYGDLGR
jgi:hypothetical protein